MALPFSRRGSCHESTLREPGLRPTSGRGPRYPDWQSDTFGKTLRHVQSIGIGYAGKLQLVLDDRQQPIRPSRWAKSPHVDGATPPWCSLQWRTLHRGRRKRTIRRSTSIRSPRREACFVLLRSLVGSTPPAGTESCHCASWLRRRVSDQVFTLRGVGNTAAANRMTQKNRRQPKPPAALSLTRSQPCDIRGYAGRCRAFVVSRTGLF